MSPIRHPERAKRGEGPHETGSAKHKSKKPNNCDLVVGSSIQTSRYLANEVLRLHSNTPCSHSAQDDVLGDSSESPVVLCSSRLSISLLKKLKQGQLR